MAFGIPSVADLRAMNDTDLAALLAAAKDREDQLLAALQSGETQALDSLKALAKELFAELLAAGETHRVRITQPGDGKGGTLVEWESKPGK